MYGQWSGRVARGTFLTNAPSSPVRQLTGGSARWPGFVFCFAFLWRSGYLQKQNTRFVEKSEKQQFWFPSWWEIRNTDCPPKPDPPTIQDLLWALFVQWFHWLSGGSFHMWVEESTVFARMDKNLTVWSQLWGPINRPDTTDYLKDYYPRFQPLNPWHTVTLTLTFRFLQAPQGMSAPIFSPFLLCPALEDTLPCCTQNWLHWSYTVYLSMSEVLDSRWYQFYHLVSCEGHGLQDSQGNRTTALSPLPSLGILKGTFLKVTVSSGSARL